MSYFNNPGRMIGILILVQIAGGIVSNFMLTAPLFGSPGYMVNGAIYSQQIGIAVIVGLAMSGLSIAIAITAFPIFREYKLNHALWLIVIAGVGLAVAVMENIGMLSLVSFSQAYTVASAPDRDILEAARTIVSSARNWAHYINLIFASCFLLVLNLSLFSFRLIPRLLSGFGCAAVLLQITTVSLTLFGRDVFFPLLAPLGLSQIALASWLIWKGFSIPAK